MMSPEHESQLALVRALRELGASHIRVGDVECRFDMVLAPITPALALDDALMRETPETQLARKIRDLEKDLGISRT